MGWICVPLMVFIGWQAYRGWEQMIADRQSNFREVATPVAIGAPPLRQ